MQALWRGQASESVSSRRPRRFRPETLTHTSDEFGGAGRNRTADEGFADLCLATWLPRLVANGWMTYLGIHYRAALAEAGERLAWLLAVFASAGD
jgi:hypothetical protein